jgi:hypothetical protein
MRRGMHPWKNAIFFELQANQGYPTHIEVV